MSNCPFCFSHLSAKEGFYYCESCSNDDLLVKFVLIYENSIRFQRISWINYKIGKYQIYTSKDTNQLLLYDDSKDSTSLEWQNHIMQLDYCPNINPSTAKQWLNKLLNLKSFA